MKRPAAALLVVCLLLSGCWSRRELNDTGVVVGLGIDRTEDGLLAVTMVVAAPAGVSADRRQEGKQANKHKILLRREGRTITEALRLAELAASRKLITHHVQIVLFGERLVSQGIDTVLDYLFRSTEIRLYTHPFVVRGTSVDTVLAAEPLMETLQSQALREMAAMRVGLEMSLKEVFVARATQYRAPMMPVVGMRPHPTSEQGATAFEPELTGTAVIAKNRLALFLDKGETRAILWLRGTTRNAVITIPCRDAPERYASLRVASAGRDILPRWDGRRIAFQVRLRAALRLTEMQCDGDVRDPDVLHWLESAAAQAVADRVKAVIKRTQSIPADPFEFGEHVRALMPGLWPSLGGARWPRVWADTPVDVVARMSVRQSEMTTQAPNMPTQPQ